MVMVMRESFAEVPAASFIVCLRYADFEAVLASCALQGLRTREVLMPLHFGGE
jgi:hypothetical protein